MVWAMILYRTGDILCADNTTDIIAHQVNCMGVFGAGLAKQIAEQYPEVKSEYMTYCQTYRTDLLGRCQIVQAHKEQEAGKQKIFANLFGQYSYGTSKGRCYTNYEAFRQALKTLRDYARFYSLRISFPQGIGCGLAGGDWEVIHRYLTDFFYCSDVNCEIWGLPKGATQLR